MSGRPESDALLELVAVALAGDRRRLADLAAGLQQDDRRQLYAALEAVATALSNAQFNDLTRPGRERRNAR